METYTFEGTKCSEDDCLGFQFDPHKDKFNCYCGDLDYKGCVGANSDGEWEYTVTDA